MIYESPISSGKETIAKVKVCQSRTNFKVKVTCHKVFDIKVLPLLVKKRWPRLKFLKITCRSIFKVKVTRSKIVVLMERYCRKKCTCDV